MSVAAYTRGTAIAVPSGTASMHFCRTTFRQHVAYIWQC